MKNSDPTLPTWNKSVYRSEEQAHVAQLAHQLNPQDRARHHTPYWHENVA
jgi:hypothetical protein